VSANRIRRCLLLGAGIALSLYRINAFAECKVERLLLMPLTMVGTQPLVTVRLNGIDARLLVDTGSVYTLVSPEAAKRAGLSVGFAPARLWLQGLGGGVRPGMAIVKEFGISNQTIKRVEVLVYGDRLSRNGVDGILGQNFLRLGDLEMDLANGVARLFKTTGCEHANLAYWSGSAQYGELAISATDLQSTQIIADGQVNGTDIRVMFDSGASTSSLTLPAAERAGITPQSPGVTSGGLQGGVGSALRDSWIAPFKSFKLNTEEIQNTHLRIADLGPLQQQADMLLGADFFLSHHIFIAYRLRKLFFTYNGGRVFDLSVRAPLQASAIPATSSAPAPADSPAENAADIDRRAAALVARNDLPAAIADFGRAIAAEPGNAVYHFHRGQALARSGETGLALADVDEALRLRPDLVDALMFRAQLRVRAGNLNAASTDFAAAEASAPGRYELPLDEARAYMGAGHYPLALAVLDRWIDAHPQDERHYEAMSARCLVRGMLGRELDAALADCNSARRHLSSNSQVLYNRGIVQLRRKQYDKALSDFNDTLEIQPRFASAIYARGLARIGMGDRTAGEADLQAALAMEPRVGSLFLDVDLGP
jgi:tetratricopeptide (TPR) repeat protein/predicted aspartyl protease